MPYAEGSLSKEIADSLDQHLAECESCARELRSLACTVGVLKQVEYPAMDPAIDLRSRVLAQISPQPARKSWWQSARLQAYSAAAAGLLLIALVGGGMWSMLERGMEVTATREVGQSVDTPEQPSKAPAPSEPQIVLQGPQPGVSPRKSAVKKIERRSPGEKAVFPLMTRNWSDADGDRAYGMYRDFGNRFDRSAPAVSSPADEEPAPCRSHPPTTGICSGTTPSGMNPSRPQGLLGHRRRNWPRAPSSRIPEETSSLRTVVGRKAAMPGDRWPTPLAKRPPRRFPQEMLGVLSLPTSRWPGRTSALA